MHKLDYALASLANSNRQYICKNCINIPKSFQKLVYNSKEKKNNNRESCKDDDDSEEIVKLKESVRSKEEEIENLEDVVSEKKNMKVA